jgi:hypothetical protein
VCEAWNEKSLSWNLGVGDEGPIDATSGVPDPSGFFNVNTQQPPVHQPERDTNCSLQSQYSSLYTMHFSYLARAIALQSGETCDPATTDRSRPFHCYARMGYPFLRFASAFLTERCRKLVGQVLQRRKPNDVKSSE